MKDINKNLFVVIIGSSADSFIQSISKITSKYEIEHVFCNDIYSAAAQIAKNQFKNLLVIARFENLKKENEWFLKISCQKNITCCCIKNGTFSRRSKNMNLRFIGQLEEIEDIFSELTADRINCPKPVSNKFLKEQFMATHEEIDALLQ